MSPRGRGPPSRPPQWKALLGLSLQKTPSPHSHTSLLVHTAAGDGGQGSHPQQLKGLYLLQTPAEPCCTVEGQPHTSKACTSAPQPRALSSGSSRETQTHICLLCTHPRGRGNKGGEKAIVPHDSQSAHGQCRYKNSATLVFVRLHRI